MPSLVKDKTARLDARITPDPREQSRIIAARQGRSASDYVIMALQAAVRADIAEMDVIQLSLEAPERLAAALIDPPDLTPAMRRAFAHHRLLVRSECPVGGRRGARRSRQLRQHDRSEG